jgi:hypothetical protein
MFLLPVIALEINTGENKMKGKDNMLVYGALLFVGYLIYTGSIALPAAPQVAAGAGDIVTTTSTVTMSAINAISGATLDVNGVMKADSGWRSPENQISILGDTIATAPNDFVGDVYFGNDANQGTDRGTEVYFRKIPLSYTNQLTPMVLDTDGGSYVKLYAEATSISWTGYDDGSAEATLNVSVASGATVTSTELKMAAPTDAAIGNPDFTNPLGVCFNATVISDWDELRPTNYVSTFSPPDFLRGKSVVGDCYVLPTEAVIDYAEYRFYIILDAASGVDPVAGENVYVIPMDYTWHYNDAGEFVAGFGDDSDQGTDYDPGIDGLANAKVIYLS